MGDLIHNLYINIKRGIFYRVSKVVYTYFIYRLLAQGQTQGSAPRAHQQALTTGPFSYTYEANAVSPKAPMGGLQDKDVYNQGNYQVDSILEQYNMHILLIRLDLFNTSIISTTIMQQ
jgi:hypothetical protein